MLRKSIILFLSMLSLMLCLGGCGKSVEKQISEQLELGQKYLAEAKYEEAIAAFNKAIELDPKTWAAYQGKAFVNEKQEKKREAMNCLEQGIEAIGAENVPTDGIDFLIAIYRELADTAQEGGDFEGAEDFCNRTLILRPDDQEAIDEKKLLEKSAAYEGKIKNAVQSVLAENYEIGASFLQTDEFKNYISKLDKPMIFQTNTEKVIVVYHLGHVYYGNMQDGKREDENGILLQYGSNTVSYFKGVWKDDLPNGEGDYYTYVRDEKYSISIEGSWRDGLENGDMIHVDTSNNPDSIPKLTFSYHADNGIPKGIGMLSQNGTDYLIISEAPEYPRVFGYTLNSFPLGISGCGVEVGRKNSITCPPDMVQFY